MNLIEAFNAFDSWTRLNTLSANQRSLYIAILQLWNAAGRPEYSSIPEQKLTELSGLSKKTFYNVRNQLEEFGLIGVVKSKSKNIAPKYTLKDISVKNDDNFTPISTPNVTPILTPKVTPNLAPYTEKRIEEESREEDDIVKDDSVFFDALQKNLGRGITYPESQLARVWREDLSDVMIIKAVSIAVLSRVTNFNYIDSIIKNWIKAGITTLSELQAHEEKRERSKQNTSTKPVKSAPDWSNPSYKNKTTAEDLRKLEELRQESLSKLETNKNE
ncbi:DnaD domain protein [Lactococcus lactis]|nr:DnaD domain protein [Lactococcus lactis]